MSSKSLQEWKYAAEQSGFSLDTIEGSAKKLTKTMGSYADGNKSTIAAFKELGVSAEDSHGKLKTTNDVFPELIASLADMTDITKRDTLSMAIFGKSAMDMGPMLNEGSDGIEAMKIKANELGLVMSNDSVTAGAKFDDMMTTVKASLSAMVTKVGTEVLPIVQSMLEWIMAHMPQIQAIASFAFDVISIAVKAVGDFITNTLMPAFNSFWAWLQPNIPVIQKTIEDAFKVVKTVIDDVSTAITAVIDWCVKFQNILVPLVAGVTAAGIAFGIYTLAIKAITLAKTAWTTVTTLATTVGTAFGAVMAFITSPIGIVVIAIGLLVAAGVLLYKNWDVVKTKASEIFGSIGKFIGGVVDGIKDGFKGMVNGVISGLNFMIRALNKLNFTVPDWVPLIGGQGFGFNIPTIPSFAVGTRYLPEDMLIQAHKGEMIVPKSENPYANSGGSVLEKAIDKKQDIYFQLDGKTFAKVTAPYSDRVGGTNMQLVERGLIV